MSEFSAFNASTWAKDNLSGCELGDDRRTQRLVKVAQQVADRSRKGPAANPRSPFGTYCALPLGNRSAYLAHCGLRTGCRIGASACPVRSRLFSSRAVTIQAGHGDCFSDHGA
jgi:hypothetical protein